ncbi:tyrosine phosphatase family protein [Mycobacteroides abscessus subsp. bolletii 1513]|uniref:Tyrosine phosphatase family protein n=1 Tax=Mycobacteroides abscessus subsp. bolletii 1513 TaxID=1299321 RepID=X8DDP8_9MYCO|nr:tyrosine phosphatase family protein [Mycobacteroides abscessus subsp. bolletii 1513]
MTISSAESKASPADNPVEGIWNFRDVGGADSPVTIRPGVLFRSSELSGLSPGRRSDAASIRCHRPV